MYSRGLRHLWDHPRTCGENVSFSASCYDCVGITPAPAGKTLYLYYLPFLRWDHPRTCGENPMFTSCVNKYKGSPPHLRGKHSPICYTFYVYRITPAPAGKTKSHLHPEKSIQDHPRTCGENCRLHSRFILQWGSPPHLRGKLVPTL